MKRGRGPGASARFRLFLVVACVAALGIGMMAALISAAAVRSPAAEIAPSKAPWSAKATPEPADSAAPTGPTATGPTAAEPTVAEPSVVEPSAAVPSTAAAEPASPGTPAVTATPAVTTPVAQPTAGAEPTTGPEPTAAVDPTATQPAAAEPASPASKTVTTGTIPVAAAHVISPALDAEINGIINAYNYYDIGVAMIDLSDGVVHQCGTGEPFEAASTAKVLAAAAYYHSVETGEASLDDPMGEATSGSQIREMIQNSDNDSWSMIMDAVGYEQLRGFAASIGVSYDPELNILTPAEMATILADLYSGKLLNQDDTAQLLSYMTNTNYDELIPAAVPAGVAVFHKYGMLDRELHDAGILAQGTRAYAFVVYTRGADWDDAPDRIEVIHQLTQAVVHALF